MKNIAKKTRHHRYQHHPARRKAANNGGESVSSEVIEAIWRHRQWRGAHQWRQLNENDGIQRRSGVTQ